VNFLTTPLGNSSLSKGHAPAWSIETLKNRISASAELIHVRGTQYGGALGSATVATNITGCVQRIPQLDIEIDYKTYSKNGQFSPAAISGYLTADVFLSLKPDYLLIDVLEENTDFAKENFDIEVFYTGPSGITTTDDPAPMAFLEDDSVRMPQPLPGATTSNNGPNVEYYMDILTDKEIPESILAGANALDSAASRTSTRLRFTRDLYTTENEEPCD